MLDQGHKPAKIARELRVGRATIDRNLLQDSDSAAAGLGVADGLFGTGGTGPQRDRSCFLVFTLLWEVRLVRGDTESRDSRT
jgi:hypothetical protein